MNLKFDYKQQQDLANMFWKHNNMEGVQRQLNYFRQEYIEQPKYRTYLSLNIIDLEQRLKRWHHGKI